MKPLKSLFALLFDPRTALLLVVCTIFLTSLRLFGVRLETVHLVGFPFLLVGISTLPKISTLRIPKALLFSVLVLWFLGALDTRGFTTGLVQPATIYLSRLHGDSFGGQTRQFLNTYRDNVTGHSSITLDVVQRVFESPEDGQRWLSSRPSVRALVIGGPTFAKIIPNVRAAQDVFSKSGVYEAERTREVEKSFASTMVTAELRINHPKGAREPRPELRWVVFPEYLAMPIHPPALASTYLSKLIAGYESALTSGPGNAQSERYLRAAQTDAIRFRDRSSRAGAQFLRSSFSYLGFLATHADGTPARNRGIKAYRREFEMLSRRLDQKANPQLASAVLNNLAVLRLTERRDPRTEARALKELALAESFHLRDGSLVRSAEIARHNRTVLGASDRAHYVAPTPVEKPVSPDPKRP